MTANGRVHWSFWVIGAVALVYNLAGVANFITQMSADAVAGMPEAYRAFVAQRPVWATAAFAIAVFGGALGCLLLLLRKSLAYYVFIVSLLGALATMAHVFAVADSGVGPVGLLMGNLVQVAVTLMLIWYAKHAQRKSWIS